MGLMFVMVQRTEAKDAVVMCRRWFALHKAQDVEGIRKVLSDPVTLITHYVMMSHVEIWLKFGLVAKDEVLSAAACDQASMAMIQVMRLIYDVKFRDRKSAALEDSLPPLFGLGNGLLGPASIWSYDDTRVFNADVVVAM